MGQIVAILLHDLLETVIETGNPGGIGRFGGQQRLGELERGFDPLDRVHGCGGVAVVQGEQLPQGVGGRPAGEAVIAQIEQAAGFQIPAGEFADDPVIVAADPGPDAVQADAVELGQIVAVQQLFETVVVEPRLAAGGGGQTAGVGGMGGIEIGGDIATGIGGGVNVDRYALPEAQFAVCRVQGFGDGEAADQQAETLIGRGNLAIVAVGVAYVGKVAFVPDLAHGIRFD